MSGATSLTGWHASGYSHSCYGQPVPVKTPPQQVIHPNTAQAGRSPVPRSRRAAVASSLVNAAADMFESGDVEGALRYTRAALVLAPDSGRALGQVCVLQGALFSWLQRVRAGEDRG